MNKDIRNGLIAAGAYVAVMAGLAIHTKRATNKRLAARRKSYETCVKSYGVFIEMLEGLFTVQVPDPNLNERTKLTVHKNHGDVNLNKESCQK